MRPFVLWVICCSGLASALGCTKLELAPLPDSPLAQPKMSANSVALDIFFVRIPHDTPDIDAALWSEVDEQSLDVGLRKRLAENGFKVGQTGGQIPLSLERLIELEGPELLDKPTGTEQTVSVDEQTRVQGRHLQLRSGQRSEVVASGIHPKLPVLIRDDGQLRGSTRKDAQGVFALKAFPGGDGGVRLELIPEVHYGEVKQRWAGSDGVWRLDAGRDRDVLHRLSIECQLSPGKMLVIGGLEERSGSLGQSFFTEKTGGRLERKLLIVRLAQTQYDDLFSAPTPASSDESP